jgi:hypothetical protein
LCLSRRHAAALLNLTGRGHQIILTHAEKFLPRAVRALATSLL